MEKEKDQSTENSSYPDDSSFNLLNRNMNHDLKNNSYSPNLPTTPTPYPKDTETKFKLNNPYNSRGSVTGEELFDILSREEDINSYYHHSGGRSKTIVGRRPLSKKKVEKILSENNDKKENTEILANNSENSQIKSKVVRMFTIEDIKINESCIRQEAEIKNKNLLEKNLYAENFHNTCDTKNNEDMNFDKYDSPSINDNVNDFIDSKLREVKLNMMKKLDQFKTQLELKYDDHIEKIKRSVLQKAKRIKQVLYKYSDPEREKENFNDNESPTNQRKDLEYMRKYTLKNVGEKLDQFFDIHSKIESSLEKNFEILSNFIDQFDLIQDKPLQTFINENADDILNSWIFSKINFEKIDTISLIESEKIPNILKNFIFQDTVNKFSTISVNKSKNYDFEKKLLFDNHLILEKLTFKNLDHAEFLKIFSQISAIEGIQFNKLKEISFSDSKIESMTFNNLFPNTEKIYLANCLLKVNFQNIAKDFSKLKILSLTKSNLCNKSFSYLIEEFSNSNQLLENLETFNLSNNKISVFDLSYLSNYKKQFNKLQVLILSKNKLYKFTPQNFTCLPNLKLLNLSSNNFTSGKDLLKIKEKLKELKMNVYTSMNKNLFLLNDPANISYYIDYLIDNLKTFDFFLRNLDLSYIFNNFNKNKINDFYLNSNLQISIKKINFSYSALDSNLMVNFIKNNSGFINLRILNISNNFIDDMFLESYVSENFVNLLENLEVIDLSHNRISDLSINNLEIIIKSQKRINKIKLNHNPIENSFVQYINSRSEENREEALELKNQSDIIEIKNCSKEEILQNHISSNNLSCLTPGATKLITDENEYMQHYLFCEFIENLCEIKKDFKLVFSKSNEEIFCSLGYQVGLGVGVGSTGNLNTNNFEKSLSSNFNETSNSKNNFYSSMSNSTAQQFASKSNGFSNTNESFTSMRKLKSSSHVKNPNDKKLSPGVSFYSKRSKELNKFINFE
jgi:hypothetical protein